MKNRYGKMDKKGEKPIANPLVVLREEFDDWAVLFDAATGHGFGLSPTGVYLWKLLDGEHSVDDLLTVLRRDAENVLQEAGDHLVAFLEELTRHGLAVCEAEQVQRYEGHTLVCSADAERTQFTYEAPRLINLSGEQPAMGACCNSGTYATGDGCGCFGNCVAWSTCYSGGCAGSYCGDGSSASDKCMNGSSAPYQCNCGTSLYNNGYTCGYGNCDSVSCSAFGSNSPGLCSAGSSH